MKPLKNLLDVIEEDGNLTPCFIFDNRIEMSDGSLGDKVELIGNGSWKNDAYQGISGQKEYIPCNIWTKVN